jgi:drug/metabolite transporter (DMT)-like permease
MLGAFLALIAAITFGLNNASVRRGVLSGTVFQALFVTVALGIIMFFIPAVVTGEIVRIPELSTTQLLCFSAAGIVHFIIGRYCNYGAVRALGSNLAGGLIQLQILVSLVVAMIFLDERLTILKSLGIVMAIGASLITLYGRSTATENADLKFTPNYLRGFILGIVGGIGYGIGPVLVRSGLTSAGDAMIAGCVSYSSAFLVLLMLLVVSPSQRREAITIERMALRWFVLSGVAVSISQFFVYLALSMAPVTVVIPIVQLYTIFRLIFSWYLNRGYEVFDGRVVIGIFLALLGAVLLATDADTIANALNVSDDIRHAFHLTWP